MGIKNLNQFLRGKCPEIFVETHISEFAYKKLAIDISLYLHKFKAAAGDRWLQAFLNFVVCLRRNNVHCTFIYDGQAPPEKAIEQADRRESQQKLIENVQILEQELELYNITGEVGLSIQNLWEKKKSPPETRLLSSKLSDGIDMKWVQSKIESKMSQIIHITENDILLTKNLFDILNVPYFTAPCEAEKLCSLLCKDGRVDAVLSEDTDILAYGCPIFLSKIDSKNDTVIMVEYTKVLSSLSLSSSQFLDLCIMSGTDYNKNIPKIGNVTSYKKILQYGSIEELEKKENLDTSILNYIRVRELFTQFKDDGITKISFCGIPKYEDLIQFSQLHNLHINIPKLKSSFETEIILEE